MKGRFARLVIGVAVLPLVFLGVGLLLITNGGSSNGADHGVGSVKIVPVASTNLSGLTRHPSFVSNSRLPPGSGALVAQITVPTAIRSSPGAPASGRSA